MKLFLFYLVIAVGLTFTAVGTVQAQAFQAGEKLTYNISFANFSDAGFVELNTIGREKLNERDVIRLQAKLRTTGTVQSTLLSLENEYVSLISPETNFPLRVERTLRESNAPTEVRRDFAENLTANFNNTHDLLSAIYHVRTLPLAVGATFPIKVWENDQIYDAELRVTGRDTVSTVVGAFNVFVVQIRVSNNDNLNRYRMQILISDDDRHLPVAIRSRHPKGDILAELASVQIVLPEIIVPQPEPIPTPIAVPTPRMPPTPRPTPVPKPYLENQPLAADLPFTLGEKLRFDVSLQNQKIGSIALEIKERKQFFGRDAVQLSAMVTASTNGNILPNASMVNSFIHPDYLTPYRSEIRTAGNLAKFNRTLTFDQERGSVASDKGTSAEIPVGTHDVLSLAYALRAFRFDVVPNNPLSNPIGSSKLRDTKAAVYLSGAPTIVTFRATGVETIEIAGRKIKTIAISMTTGDPRIDSLNLRLWLSDDNRRLPMRFAFNTPLGAVQADLVADR
ncbi:MAG TPA: DUF3108 domain-containing protein [Pyrinomonadaceae bacterium]|nr:DUF3108 domain-containing protein [Pyrinomonadaceae bacterium]